MFSDVDECTVGSHFCDDICHNTLGSFTCHCRSGYRLMADLKTCLGTENIRFISIVFISLLIKIKYSLWIRVGVCFLAFQNLFYME